jgi:hypothetical protein
MLSLAVVRLLEIIGEAAQGVSGSFREAHPEISWTKMAGMRDRLIHGYFAMPDYPGGKGRRLGEVGCVEAQSFLLCASVSPWQFVRSEPCG